jgi:hypothetical protein
LVVGLGGASVGVCEVPDLPRPPLGILLTLP